MKTTVEETTQKLVEKYNIQVETLTEESIRKDFEKDIENMPAEYRENSLSIFLEPSEDYLKITKPILELLQKILATIKNCQVEKIECDDYIKLSHSILDTFINQPLEI